MVCRGVVAKVLNGMNGECMGGQCLAEYVSVGTMHLVQVRGPCTVLCIDYTYCVPVADKVLFYYAWPA